MPLTPTNFEAKCDVPNCDKQAVGTLQHLSTKGWTMKALYNGQPALVSLYDGTKSNAAHGIIYPLVCPECSVMGRYK